MKSKINTVIKGIIEKIKGKIVWLTVMLSFLIALFVYIFIACYARNLKVLIAGLFAFTAPLLTFLVYFISEAICRYILKKFSPKEAILIRTGAAVLNILIIIFYETQLIFVLCMAAIGANREFKTFEKPEEYKEALKYVCQDNAKHFPDKIPAGAKHVKLHKPNDCWFGSDYFSLVFEIDKEYIDRELEKINCKETEGPFLRHEEYKDNVMRKYAVRNVGLSKENFMFCAIDSIEYGMEYGIAVNYKDNKILYYSITLD